MQKCLIFLAVLFSTSVWASPDWNPYVMTHERFVHLSSEDKEKVIIQTMEIIVEMEGTTKKAVVQNQPNKEKLEQYLVLVNKLQNLLINNAYAKDDKTLAQLIGDFNQLRKDLGTTACIYAGYISKIVTGRCVSPGLISAKTQVEPDKSIRAAYIAAANENALKSGKCEGATKISCNPVIFGYKKVDKAIPFCVTTSPTEAHNAAFSCMKEVLTDNKDKTLTDSKTFRLENLKAAMADKASAKAFNEGQSFLFKTCMCGNKELNEAYVGYMKPHRTCFGMINTLREIDYKECSALKEDKSPFNEFAKNWQTYYAKKTATRDNEFDKAYKGVLATAEMQQLCAPPTPATDTEAEGIECSPDCKKDEKGAIYCSVTTITSKTKGDDGKIVKTVVTEFKEAKLLLANGENKLTYEAKEGGATYVCDAKAPNTEEKLECKLTANYADKEKPIVTLEFTGLKKGQEGPKTITWAGPGAVTKDNKVFNAIATAEAVDLIATFTPDAVAAPAAAKTTDAKNTADTKAAAAEKKDETKTENKDETKTADQAKAASSDNSCTLKIQIPAETDGDKKVYKISTSLAPYQPADVMVKVLAAVTLADGQTLPADYEIVWIREGYKGAKPEVKADPTVNVAGDTNGTKDETATTATPATEPPVAKGGPGAKDASIDETRMVEVYSTCAQLLDGAKKQVDKSCQQIPVLAPPQPSSGPARPGPIFMTPSYNTRTMGIQ
jgi:hypothetical protein